MYRSLIGHNEFRFLYFIFLKRLAICDMEQLSTAEAILFFDDLKIVKEMTFLEFQAILDSYVPLHDMANRTMGAAYVRINVEYHVTAAVFFVLILIVKALLNMP